MAFVFDVLIPSPSPERCLPSPDVLSLGKAPQVETGTVSGAALNLRLVFCF
jgi:hypothetical protein